MNIQEVAQQVHMTKRAIKYYEEKGLLQVEKGANGYRVYTDEHVVILQRIQVYRKLGMELSAIRRILQDPQVEAHELRMLQEQLQDSMEQQSRQMETIQLMLAGASDYGRLEEQLDYQTIASAIQEMIPGVYGKMFMHHFLPYLQIPIVTQEQRDAYYAIIQFWDTTKLHMPLSMKIISCLLSFLHKNQVAGIQEKLDQQLKMLLEPDEKRYAQMKKAVLRQYRMQKYFLFRYLPSSLSKRRWMMELQRSGYNDVFLPNMEKLSPSYREYRRALFAINDKICTELNLVYDEHFCLVKKAK
ncbi:MerR family transcriptional regulator [Erysipelotrichaceae bacterium AF15-26LB]|nr:transcriptional regulator, MerR family [Erysipelotrichaceae bacterium 3_1_53]MCR0349021.1 MerR family transcriptional regulator [[Clostridium] innocuum]RJV90831.1 MerR family transcriptional regulator [Erysipelotrichaceae bacterium AF15-26LB]RJV93524.1 MerR family transcriptional regulator [Erysipelotrichaceae bacterium AF19-24AC]